jgi:hypothetical protein
VIIRLSNPCIPLSFTEWRKIKMPIRGDDLAKMTDAEIRARFPAKKCYKCEIPIDRQDEGKYSIEKKPVCGDCYFHEMSCIVEKYPIHRLGR